MLVVKKFLNHLSYPVLACLSSCNIHAREYRGNEQVLNQHQFLGCPPVLHNIMLQFLRLWFAGFLSYYSAIVILALCLFGRCFCARSSGQSPSLQVAIQKQEVVTAMVMRKTLPWKSHCVCCMIFEVVSVISHRIVACGQLQILFCFTYCLWGRARQKEVNLVTAREWSFPGVIPLAFLSQSAMVSLFKFPANKGSLES